MNLLLTTVGLLQLLTVAALALTVRFFLAREAEWRGREEDWRKRERHIIDDAARAHHVSVPRVEQERVVKIADAETANFRTDIDEAMYQDDLLEDLQHHRNLGHEMTPGEAASFFPMEWAEVKRNYDDAHRPMTIK